MPTPGERKAMLFLGAVALLGAGAQAEKARRPSATVGRQPQLDAQIAAVDSARQAERKGSDQRGRRSRTRSTGAPQASPVIPEDVARPMSPGGEALVVNLSSRSVQVAAASRSRIDLDMATAAEIERLPRVGPVLAARIVGDRDARGPFGSLAELGRVSGVGPSMLSALEPQVTFSLAPRHSSAGKAPSAHSPRRK